MAVATDSKTNSASSVPVNFTVKTATGPAVTNEVFHVISTGVATNLKVLANDTASTNGGSLRIVGVNKWQNPFTTVRFGSVKIGYGATNLVYQANPYSFGTNWISYDVADSNGTNTGIATVIVHALPQATITAPTNGTVYPTNSVSTNVSGTSMDYDGSISNVTLYVNGLPYGSPTTSTNFSFSWSTNTAGFYTFVAVARDNDGFTNGSPPVIIILDPPGGSLPVAVISNLVSTLVTTNYSTFTITNPPILRDGLYDLLGQARDSDNTPSYQVVLRRPGETIDFANVTPVPIGGALNYQGFRDGSDNSGDLGILNLSTVPNGVYDLILRVRGGGDQVSTPLRVTIDNALKIGQFSFSEQDLVIPVNGIPLTVVRTYNSFNPGPGRLRL